MSTMTPVAAGTFDDVTPEMFDDGAQSHWTAEDFTIRTASERADCCPSAAAVVLTAVTTAEGNRVPMRFCKHHTDKYQRVGADFGQILVDNRSKLDVKPGASA